jgi:hypothetical protein
MLRVLFMGDSVKEAIDARRFHHQLMPMQVQGGSKVGLGRKFSFSFFRKSFVETHFSFSQNIYDETAKSFREKLTRKRRNFAKTVTPIVKVFVFAKGQKVCSCQP